MHFFLVQQHTTDDSGIVMHCKSTQNGRADSGADNTMTTEQFHEELRKCGFYKIDTGGGCDALVAELKTDKGDSVEVMLTQLDDPSVPEADEPVQVGVYRDEIGSGVPALFFVLNTPAQVLAFAQTALYSEV